MRTLLATALALLVGAAPAAAAEPKLSEPAGKLRQALVCEGKLGPERPAPILFSTGTGSNGPEGLSVIEGALKRLGRPICYTSYPAFATGDIQIAAEYMVYAIRRVHRRAGQPIAIYGISQGALIPRGALTFWPSLRQKVADVVAVAGTQHGTSSLDLASRLCGDEKGCVAAAWQQAAGSKFQRALNRPGRDETPGRTSWTTVRTLTDEVVTPQDGPDPTSALRGASNIVIQDVCPGRSTSHLLSYADSVAIAALRDAITHRGAARVSRLPATVCDTPYGPGIDAAALQLVGELGSSYLAQRMAGLPHLLSEPRVRRYARR
jgi:hypothetical protein